VQVLQAANTGITSLQKLVDTAKSIANQVLQAPTGYTSKSTITSSVLAGTSANLVDGVNIKTGDTLTIASTGGGTATNITFTASESLAQLNTTLAANNLTASLDSSNHLVITTSNDVASSTIGALVFTGGGATPATFGAATAPVADPNSQAIRTSLVGQYNNIITQITTTAQDSSFNGINLLNGDNLKLTFDETGKSTLNVTGVTYNAAGLGLASLTVGTDFLDNNSANAALTALGSASTTLRTEASALGSNLSVVQLRQDFNKNLINVLQTGASNLTLADANEEAANSQALSTRQSIAVSALSLANQSQQSVLQLLR
jgi:flagellin